jgi:uncharacterized membrane protein (UPF0127 family)
MEKVIVTVGNKSYRCQVAKTEEQRKKGLQDIEHLPIDEGMLFVWEDEATREMWMKDTKIPLDQIAINDDDEVVLVYTAQPEDETLVPFMNAKYILEVNANSGIVEGDDFEIDDSDDLNKYVMKVLAPDGSTQMYLQGGERIVSRKETRTLIKKAKKAYANKVGEYDRYCKALGKYMFKILKGQDTREPEYVSVPDKD